MIDDIGAARDAALARIATAATLDEVVRLDSELLGKRGPLATLKSGLGALGSAEDKKAAGQALNEAQRTVTDALEARRQELATREREARVAVLAGNYADFARERLAVFRNMADTVLNPR